MCSIARGIQSVANFKSLAEVSPNAVSRFFFPEMKNAIIPKAELKTKFLVSGGADAHRKEIQTNFNRLIDDLPSCRNLC